MAASLRPPSLPPNPGSGLQLLSEPHTTPAPPGHTFGTGNCVSMAGLGFAASLAVAMSGDKRTRSLGQEEGWAQLGLWVIEGDGEGEGAGGQLGKETKTSVAQVLGRPEGGGWACPPLHSPPGLAESRCLALRVDGTRGVLGSGNQPLTRNVCVVGAGAE